MEKYQQNNKVSEFLRIDKAKLLKSKKLKCYDIPTINELFKSETYSPPYYLLCPNCGGEVYLKKKNEEYELSNFYCHSCHKTFRTWIEEVTEDVPAKSKNSRESVMRSVAKDTFSLIVFIYDCNEIRLENDSLNEEIVDYLLQSETWYYIQQNKKSVYEKDDENDIDSLIKNEKNEEGNCIVFVIKNIGEHQNAFSSDKLSRLNIEKTLNLMINEGYKLSQQTRVDNTFLEKLKFKKP
jgi:hypothetical protein